VYAAKAAIEPASMHSAAFVGCDRQLRQMLSSPDLTGLDQYLNASEARIAEESREDGRSLTRELLKGDSL
jgi:hypothetical protein